MASPSPPRVALIAWGRCLEHDFLQGIGVTLEEFRRSFRASWHFDYVLALREAGVETTSFVFSCCRPAPETFVHEPTRSRFRMLPAVSMFGRADRRNASPLAEYTGTPLRRLARAIRADGCSALLVQGHDYARFDLTVLLGRLMGLPVFSTYQGGADPRGGRAIDRIRTWSFRRAAGLNVPSDLELSRIQRRYGIDPARVARILNPIDTAFWHPVDRTAARQRFGLSPGDTVFAWHGRVGVAQKGLDLLVEAWRLVDRRTSTPVVLHLLGSGAERDTLARLASDAAGIRWIDRFASDREEIRDFLSSADAYVFPSRAEGFAVAPVEAMACGLPVIASRTTPGIDELFPRGREDGGVLLPTLDPATLADAMIAVASDASALADLSRRAVARAARLSLPHVGRQLAAFLGLQSAGSAPAAFPFGRTVQPDPLRLAALHPGVCRAGEPFNPQPDGQSAIVAVAEHATRATQVIFDGVPLDTVFGDPRTVSAVVPARLLRRPRVCAVQLSDGVRESEAMQFEIQQRG